MFESVFALGLVPYLNMRPVALQPLVGSRFYFMTPRNLLAGLKNKQILAAPAPVGGLHTMKAIAEPLGNFGIAAHERVDSVLFFSRIPFEQFSATHTMYLSQDSSSSVQLLCLLLAQNGSELLPRIIHDKEEADGMLVIGDAALVYDRTHCYPYRTDLVSLWHERFDHSFVFARWMVRKDVPAWWREKILAWLNDIESNRESLIQQASQQKFLPLGILPKEANDYLHRIIYRLGSDECQGESLFLSLAERFNHFSSILAY